MQDFRQDRLSSRFIQIIVESLQHERKKIREVGFEFSVESDGDRLNYVDNDHLKTRIRCRRPEFPNGDHDRCQVISNVLFDHGNEETEILEIIFL